jgi:hypothetical protein
LRRSSGQPVGDRESLTIVTTDFLATGGDEILIPVMPFRRRASIDGPIIRDEIAQRLIRTGGHWRAADLLSPSNRRLTYPGTRPVKCG